MAYSKKATKQSDVEFAQGIYIKRKENESGGYIALSIRREDGGYDKYTFFPKKKQEREGYIDYYGIVNNFKGE